MAIVYVDGFEEYSANFPLSAAYSNNNASLGYTGRFGGAAIRGINNSEVLRKPVSTTDTLAVGFAYQDVSGSVGNTSYNLLRFYNSSNSSYLTGLWVTTTGALMLTRDISYGINILATSAASVIKANTWHYIEIEFTRNASAGAANVYVDGVQVINATGQNTGAYSVEAVDIGAPNDSRLDDLYIASGATRVGECRVDMLIPNADTAQKDFTPSTGSDNYACVDTLPVSTASYVSANAASKEDLYTGAALTGSPTVFAVMPVIAGEKTDTGVRTVRTEIVSGSTPAHGTEQVLSSTYALIGDVYETDPATSTAWTLSGVNALEIGMSIVE